MEPAAVEQWYEVLGDVAVSTLAAFRFLAFFVITGEKIVYCQVYIQVCTLTQKRRWYRLTDEKDLVLWFYQEHATIIGIKQSFKFYHMGCKRRADKDWLAGKAYMWLKLV